MRKRMKSYKRIESAIRGYTDDKRVVTSNYDNILAEIPMPDPVRFYFAKLFLISRYLKVSLFDILPFPVDLDNPVMKRAKRETKDFQEYMYVNWLASQPDVMSGIMGREEPYYEVRLNHAVYKAYKRPDVMISRYLAEPQSSLLAEMYRNCAWGKPGNTYYIGVHLEHLPFFTLMQGSESIFLIEALRIYHLSPYNDKLTATILKVAETRVKRSKNWPSHCWALETKHKKSQLIALINERQAVIRAFILLVRKVDKYLALEILERSYDLNSSFKEYLLAISFHSVGKQ